MDNENDNKNSYIEHRPTILEADELVDELIHVLNNAEYRRWYYKLVYELGTTAVRNILARVSDAKVAHKGRLFSAIANEALKIKQAKKKLGDIRGQKKD